MMWLAGSKLISGKSCSGPLLAQKCLLEHVKARWSESWNNLAGLWQDLGVGSSAALALLEAWPGVQCPFPANPLFSRCRTKWKSLEQRSKGCRPSCCSIFLLQSRHVWVQEILMNAEDITLAPASSKPVLPPLQEAQEDKLGLSSLVNQLKELGWCCRNFYNLCGMLSGCFFGSTRPTHPQLQLQKSQVLCSRTWNMTRVQPLKKEGTVHTHSANHDTSFWGPFCR